ncbi:MAG: S-methyl-5-thioribose-1-phosphate isomerase [Candidatus Omnitrophica bacterium]|nr:S-methyl-5-thioribose-1-phosphate isomerase [Candidatus Omnitrophota bacterium]
MKESPLFWPCRIDKDVLFVLDETAIPERVQYIPVANTNEAITVIKEMKTRAFGQFLVVLSIFLVEIERGKNFADRDLCIKIGQIAEALNKSRPTFPFAEVTSIVVNWAKTALETHQDLKAFVVKNINGYLQGVKYSRLDRVKRIAEVIKDGDSILTHCNVSGELAMAAAIGMEQNKKVKFYATETRPYFQGAKLTAWELKNVGADVTLIADNAVGYVMANKLVNKVIVGSDRNCANGDFANKIGTYQIAVLAKEFNLPFYVLTQPSNKIASGADIPVEIRDENELLRYEGKKSIKGHVKGFYPGFDVVPHELVTGGHIALQMDRK